MSTVAASSSKAGESYLEDHLVVSTEIEKIKFKGEEFDIENLASGSFKDVFLAKNSSKKFVLCLYKKGEITEIEKEFQTIKFLSQNKFRLISDPSELYISDKISYLIYPYLTKKTLFEYCSVEEYTMNKREILIVERQIAKGIQHLHKLGIVHRDIKPENILWIQGEKKGFSWIQITDLGAAQDLKNIKYSLKGVSFEYLLPNLLIFNEDSPKEDIKNIYLINDIWGFAALCFEIEKKIIFPVYGYGVIFNHQIQRLEKMIENQCLELDFRKEQMQLQKIQKIIKKNIQEGWNFRDLKKLIDHRLTKIAENKRVILNDEKERLEEISKTMQDISSFGGHDQLLITTSRFVREILNPKEDLKIDKDFLAEAIFELNQSLTDLFVTTV
jgi:serine/threonine protein kinase